MTKPKLSGRMLLPCLFAAVLLAQSVPPPGEASRSTIEVKPGQPAIKTSELDRRPIAPWKRLPGYLLKDQKAIWTSPFHTAKSDIKWWVIFGTTGAALIATDHWTSRQLPNTSGQISVATWTSRIGAAYTLGGLDAGFYFLGALTKNDHLRETGFIGAEALANALIVDTLVKGVTQRERPTEGNGAGRFWSGSGRIWNAGSSFPSGHAIESWTFASVIAHEYPHPRIIPIAAYGLAATVCGARFAARKHFASDVVIGAALGWFIGDFVYGRRHNPAVEPKSKVAKVLSHIHIGGPLN